jgi:hypothetical protein
MVALLSELEAYRFLRSQFKDEEDVYHQRIMLRESEYRQLVPDLCRAVKAGKASKPERWEPAWVLLPELKRRFQDAVSINL